MTYWKVTNRNTGETRIVQDYNNYAACEQCGWEYGYCDCDVHTPEWS